jgi:hypothetical protein
MNDTRVNGVGSSNEAQLSSRQTIDAGRLAQSILSTNGRGSTRSVDGIKADLDQLQARNPDLADTVRSMVVAGLTPVERGQLAAANDAGPPRAARTVTGPDNQPIVFQPGAPSIAERFAAPAGSASREFYNRLDRLFGDGNPATNDVARIESGLTALYNQGQTLEQAEAAAIAAQGQPVAATGGGIDGRLIADLTQVGLDIVGIFEPTPFADLTNAGISLTRGLYDAITTGDGWAAVAGVGDAAISVAGVVPGIGDTAKLLRLGRHADTVARAITAALENPALRRQLEPLLRGIKDTLDNVSPAVMDALPQGAADSIRAMKAQLDEFFGVAPNRADEVAGAAGSLSRPLISEQRATHILHGDATGGGHLFPGGPGKSSFPQSWSADRILDEVNRIASDASIAATVQRNGRTVKDVEVDGVMIRVVQESAANGGGVVTAFPTNVPRNPL